MLWTAGDAGLGPQAKVAALGCFRLVAHDGHDYHAWKRESTVLARQEHAYALPPPYLASPVCKNMCILGTFKTTIEYILILEIRSLNNLPFI
jgi:hypothetical protein